MGKQRKTKDDWDLATTAQRAWMIFRVISDGFMDQEKIKRLLEVADQPDQIKLKVLHNAAVNGLKGYQAVSTSAHLTDWQRAESALETFITELWDKHFESQRSLANILAVAEYLNAQGWKAGKSTLYKHQKEGKLRQKSDGTFRQADVEKYASAYLKRRDGSDTGKLDQLQQERVVAETRKAMAQAEHWEIKTRAFSGDYVPKEFFELELAKRAAVIRNDLESFARSESAGIIHLVNGEDGKVSDLVDHLLDRIGDFLEHYAEEKEFKVPPPISLSGNDDMLAEDEDKE